jgi:tetratricopeptide (TPR) repeat protein
VRLEQASYRSTLLLAVALLALILRLVYLAQISEAAFFHLRFGDAAAYHEWAVRIAGGDWLGTDVFYQAPLYPYFLAAVYSAFGEGAAMVRFIQAVIGTGSCVLLAAAGMSLFGPRGAIAGVLLAVYPPAIFLDGLLEKTTLVTFFMAALLYVLSAATLRFRALLAGGVLGLLTLTRENALVVGLPVLVWLAAGDQPSPSDHSRTPAWRWPTAAAFLGGCAIVLLPVAARNLVVGGEFHLTTSQFGPNLYIGNHAGARGLYQPLIPGHGSAADEREDATRLAEEAAGRRLTPEEVSSFWTSKAVEFIRTHPGEWLRQLARKLALTYNAVEIADTESFDVYAESSTLLRALAPLSFAVIFGAAVMGVCLTARAWRRLWFLHAITLTYTLSIVVFYVFARYRFPLVPVLMILAAGGLAAWPDTSGLQRAVALALLGLAAGVAHVPLEQTTPDRVVHYVNIANSLLTDPARWDQAADYYARALEASPRSPAAHYGIGALLARMDKPKDALVHYRAAVEGWPDNADLRIHFATALIETGDLKGALDQFHAAAALRPDDPTPHAAAGEALSAAGNLAEALEAFERALALEPDNQAIRDHLERVRQALGGER